MSNFVVKNRPFQTEFVLQNLQKFTVLEEEALTSGFR